MGVMHPLVTKQGTPKRTFRQVHKPMDRLGGWNCQASRVRKRRKFRYSHRQRIGRWWNDLNYSICRKYRLNLMKHKRATSMPCHSIQTCRVQARLCLRFQMTHLYLRFHPCLLWQLAHKKKSEAFRHGTHSMPANKICSKNARCKKEW